MFSSFFSTAPPVDPSAPNFHPVSSKYKPEEVYGQLTPKDTEWACPGGFATETQVFYLLAEDGRTIIFQIIHSSFGVWYPTIQFTAKIYDPKTKKTIWKSVNVTNFVTPPPGHDKRSSKADEFSILFKSSPDSDHPESYTLTANPAPDLQLFFEVQRPAGIPGFKIGNDDKGGFSYFGSDVANPEGYVVHRFWPRFVAKGHIVQNGQATAVQGSGLFIHAIQGMRPNLIASSWNFAAFQSDEQGGTSAIQMEFKTLEANGRHGAGSGGVSVNVGSLAIGGKLVSVTAETVWPDEVPSDTTAVISRVQHHKLELDEETGYKIPSEIDYKWAGSSLLKDAPGSYSAALNAVVGSIKDPKGLIEKVDVLAEIPYVVKMAISYVAGTKPYVYQWDNPATLSITSPGGESVQVSGRLYNEATFIS